jgi:hypothetical protein
MMTMRSRVAVAALLIAPIALAGAQRQEQTSNFTWSDRIDAGRTVRVTNINGSVTIRAGSGDRVEVTAVKHWRRGDPARLRISASKEGNDVRICPLYEDQDDCDDGNRRWNRRDRNRDDSRNDDVSVDFTVVVPRGVHVVTGTVNGDVAVAGVTEDVEAATVNGDVSVESGRGRLTATTVSGTVQARVNTKPSSMEFTTVNGGVRVYLSPDVGADVEMTSVNGDIRSDYEMVVRGGRWDSRDMRMHVGPAGGPRLRITTVNGMIELRKR